MYIVGQERRLVDPPSQVVAGVRTVTTNMDGRDTLPRCRAHSLFYYPKPLAAWPSRRIFVLESEQICSIMARFFESRFIILVVPRFS